MAFFVIPTLGAVAAAKASVHVSRQIARRLYPVSIVREYNISIDGNYRSYTNETRYNVLSQARKVANVAALILTGACVGYLIGGGLALACTSIGPLLGASQMAMKAVVVYSDLIAGSCITGAVVSILAIPSSSSFWDSKNQAAIDALPG